MKPHVPATLKFASPLDGYRALVRDGSLTHDPAQELAVEKLEILHSRLKTYEPGRNGGWRSLFRREKQDAPQGLYMFGGVGRGKSMLMDLFFASTSFAPKRRVHFHGFMLEVHESVHRWRKLSAAERRAEGFEADDPIAPVAAKVAREAMLLCFDEFQVTDVADAMILGRLFRALFDLGVVIVITSNRAPGELYKNGLNRQLFLPSIEMLKTELDVLHLASPTDYRMKRIHDMPVYHVPLGPQSDRELDESFEALTDVKHGEPVTLDVMQGRTLTVPDAAKGVARFSFPDLCARPLGAADYLAIASRFHTLVLSDIPCMGPDKRNEAKRFVTLIDTLYDQRVKLVCSAAARPEELYVSGDGSFEFERTVSRLLEMQSHEYFEAPPAGTSN
ncbi:cell division protein ZapE [Emcibacter sp. SYSU 3D8]|uniref:cell division protein ZapE n=1 Tax=Emcibacter sp. SYSU 3D8 TaxID=3133969 RepID=UPI0031FF3187